MKNNIYRIVAVKGPLQLLNVLAVLAYQKENELIKNTNDYLIIHLSIDSNKVIKLFNVCKRIASIWNFKKIIHSSFLENEFNNKCVNFDEAKIKLKNLIGIDPKNVSMVYVCRNWKFFDELVLDIFVNSKKICYGDGGYLDVRDKFSYIKPINPKGIFHPIDAAYLINPVESEEGNFVKYKIININNLYYSSVFIKASNKIIGLKDWCRKINNKYLNNLTIILPSYGDRFYKNNRTEIKAYKQRVLSFTNLDDVLMIKSHPRESGLHSQSLELYKELINSKRKVIFENKFSLIPIELFLPFLKINKAITLSSTACINIINNNRNINLLIGIGNNFINKYIRDKWKKYYIKGEAILSIQIQQVLNNDINLITQLVVNKLNNKELSKCFVDGKSINEKEFCVNNNNNKQEILFDRIKIIKNIFMNFFNWLKYYIIFFNNPNRNNIELQLKRTLSKKNIINKRIDYLLNSLDKYKVFSKEDKALFVGCRNNYEIDLFQKIFKIKAIGIDVFSENKNIKIMDMHNLKFKNNSFNLVFASHVLEHSYNAKRAIREFIRVLKNKGILVVEVPINYKTNNVDMIDFIDKKGLLKYINTNKYKFKELFFRKSKKGEKNNYCGTDVMSIILEIYK